MIQFDDIAKAYAGHSLFSGLDWQIPAGQTIGLVGPNGAGKTTLFRLLAGDETPDKGRVIRPRGTTVGHLPQELILESEGSVLDVVIEGRRDLLELEETLATLEQRMAECGDDDEVIGAYATAQDTFRREGGYELRSNAREIASGMGFTVDDFDRPISTFSGGWQMRAQLARLLLTKPDLLLLDEPTNHLDLGSIEWLEQFLLNYDGTVITISHDRYFLNRLVDVIAELHAGTISTYHGDYDHYLEEREVRRQRLLEQAERQEKERARIQEFIDRFRYQAARASQVQSRIKQLEKMESVAVPPAYDSEIHFRFPSPPRIGKTVISAKDIAKRYGDDVVYAGVNFQLHRGDRVAFVGPNGAGKSTLLKMLAKVTEPDAGTIELGHQVETAYFAQHSVHQLNLERTILEEMHEAASYDSAPNIRSILGAFLFTGDDVHKSISVLSGGEKSRLALAKMLLEPSGCLLLDEPTNHLDIASRRVLEHALNRFEGAFCVISHDRYFLNEVVNRVVHIEGGGLRDYPGTYDEYKWRRNKVSQAAPEPDSEDSDDADSDSTLTRKERRRLSAQLRQQKNLKTGDLRDEVQALEREIESLEAELAKVEATLAKPETHQGEASRIIELQKRHGELESKLMETMAQWEEKGIELEAIENEYAAREAALRSS